MKYNFIHFQIQGQHKWPFAWIKASSCNQFGGKALVYSGHYWKRLNQPCTLLWHKPYVLTHNLLPNSASAQSLHGATPLPCQSQGSHRGQSWAGLDRMAVCQTVGPIPRSAAVRTAPLSSASWGSPGHCGCARWPAETPANLRREGRKKEVVRWLVNWGNPMKE